MAIRFVDEVDTQEQPKSKIRFLDEEPSQPSASVEASAPQQEKPRNKIRFIDEEQEPQDNRGVVDKAKGLAGSAVGGFADVGYATLEGMGALVGQATGDYDFAKTVSDFRNYAQDFYTGDIPSDVKDSFTHKAVSAIGQTPGYMVAAMSGPAGWAALGVNAYQQGRDDYLQTSGVTTETASDEQLREANKTGAITVVPMMLLERFGAGQLVRSVFREGKDLTAKELIKRITSAQVSEGATEGLQTALQNTIASEIQGYDPDRPITQGVLEAMALGAIASGAVAGPANITVASVNKFSGAIADGTINPNDLQDAELGKKFADIVINEDAAPPVGSSKPANKYANGTKEFINNLIEPLSAQMRKISPRMEAELRRTELNIGKKTNDRAAQVKPFIQKLSKLRKEDPSSYNLIAKELFNGDSADPQTLLNSLEAAGLREDYGKVREVLDEIYKDAEAFGMKTTDGKNLFIGYLDEYFPRMVKDLDGLKDSFGDIAPKNQFERLVIEREAETGKKLSDTEKTLLLESFIKNNLRKGVSSRGRSGAANPRTVRMVDDNRLQFYERPEKSLSQYIENMSTALETKKFLGHNDMLNDDNSRTKVPGRMSVALMEEFEAGNLSDQDLEASKVLIESRFGSKRPQFGIIKGAKNLGYMATLGNFGSAITQIGDFYFASYQNGILPTVVEGFRQMGGKIVGLDPDSNITMKDIGVDKDQVTIEAQEAGGFLNSSLNFVFKASGLTQIDRLAKETNLNAGWSKYRKMAKAKEKTRPHTELKTKLIVMQGPEQAAQTIQDLKDGKKSDGVLELLFNQLSDIAPISMSEMPPMYANNPNGRIFYMLKSYTIKQLNFIRQEAFSEMKQGVEKGLQGKRKEGAKQFANGSKNLLRLAAYAMIANGTADVLKDLIFGREIEPDDILIDNMLRLFGLSRYTTRIGAREGVGEAITKTLQPPQFGIINDISKDISGAREVSEMRTMKYMPLVGKLYYWREGRGAEMERKFRHRD